MRFRLNASPENAIYVCLLFCATSLINHVFATILLLYLLLLESPILREMTTGNEFSRFPLEIKVREMRENIT